MKILPATTLVTLMVLAAAIPCRAVSDTPLFRMLDTGSGLPDNNVRNMTMLPDGLMCIQTSTMLNIYDGADCHSYIYNPMKIPYTEYSGLNISYYDSHQNILWCTTRDHVWIFDLNTRNFEYDAGERMEGFGLPDTDIRSFFLDKDGCYWVTCAGGGLYLCDRNAMSAVRMELIEGMETPVIMEQSGETVWILARNGFLAGYDKSVGAFRHVVDLSDTGSRTDAVSSRMEIVSTSTGNIWIMYDHDLMLYDTSSRKLKRIESLVLGERDLYTTIAIDTSDNLWVGTARSGVSIINSTTMQAVTLPYLEQTNGNRIYHHTDISKIYADHRNGIWIATLAEGLLYLHKDIYHLHTITSETVVDDDRMLDEGVKCMAEDKDGTILTGTIKGLLRYDPATNSMSIPYRELRNELCISLYRDRQGQIWLGTFYNGAYCISDKGIRHYFYPDMTTVDISYYSGTPNFNCVRSFFEDSHGNFWISVYGGAGRFDTATGRITLLSDSHPELSRFMMVRDICELPDGDLIISGDNGSYIYSPDDDTVSADSTSVYSHKQSNQTIVDRRGLRWTATAEGLVIKDLNTDRDYTVTSETGLPDNNVLSIAADRTGNIWVSSFGALSRIMVIEGKDGYDFAVSNFGEHDGVTAGAFFQNSILVHSNGKVYFGGARGICEVIPERMFQETYSVMPKISSMRINGKAVEIGKEFNGRVILQKELQATGHITLRHDESFITFNFSNLNYANPTHTSYRYMLENFDRDWNEIHSEMLGHATYTYLEPGEYIFKVIAADNATDWSSQEASIVVTIRPPLRKSTTAYIFYAVMATGLVASGVHLTVKREKQKIRFRREQELRDQREQLDQMKFRFFTNISHELRTPLSLILLPLESLMRDMKGTPEMPRLETMHHNARELLSLVNHLLDFRKLEMGGERFNPVKGNILEFTENITDAFKDAAERKNVKIEFEAGRGPWTMDFDKDKMSKIINNLLSNALKFTPSGGLITIRLTMDGDSEKTMKLEVSDTGIGIMQEDVEHIFDRFYQSDNTAMTTGSGIGLSLVKQYAEMHSGKVTVSSEVNKGTRFCVEIPVKELPEGEPANAEEPSGEEPAGDRHADAKDVGERKKTVMIVDDNADFRTYMSSELKKTYNVIVASDGADCLKKLRKNEPDVLICDVMMPNMDGFEVTRRIKSDINTSHIPVILLTARTSDDIRLEGYETGADAYLTKPFKMSILEARIRNLIEEKQRRISDFSMKVDIEPSEVTITTLDQKLMARILECMEKNMDNTGYSVEELSSDVGMHRMNLYRKLQSLVGMTPSEFIRSIRLKRAAKILTEDPNLSVAEVSDMVGFNTPKYFSKYFREMFGCNPSRYNGRENPQKNP